VPRPARAGCAHEHERPALHHLPGSGVPDRQFPPVHAVPRVPLRARPHLLELVGADAARAAPEGSRLVGFAAFDAARAVQAGRLGVEILTWMVPKGNVRFGQVARPRSTAEATS
jgi:hypothetical protein